MIRDALIAESPLTSKGIAERVNDRLKSMRRRRTTKHRIQEFLFILRRLGLIEAVGKERTSRGWTRNLYLLAPGSYNSEGWKHPYKSLYGDRH